MNVNICLNKVMLPHVLVSNLWDTLYMLKHIFCFSEGPSYISYGNFIL